MSAFYDAIREFEEPELVCPRCHAENDPKLRPIQMDVVHWTAACDQCGHSGPVKEFRRKADP